MTPRSFVSSGLLGIALAATLSRHLSAQASDTADRPLIPSAFIAATAVPTGLSNNHDISLTAGLDVAFHIKSIVRPSIEVRGTLPLIDGELSHEKNLLAGFRFSYPRRLAPYVSALYGVGQIHYSPYLPSADNSVGYTYSSSAVLSVGGGASYNVSSSFAIRLDAQVQRYSVPVTDSHRLYTKPMMIGVEFTPRLRGKL